MQTSHYTIDLDAGTIETDQLPAILSPAARHPHDGRLYRCLPWADKTGLDWMPDQTIKVLKG